MIEIFYSRAFKDKETRVYNSSANIIIKVDFHFFHYIKTLIMVLFFKQEMGEFFENGFRVNLNNQRFFISYLIKNKIFIQKGYFVAQIIFSTF
jgi:hypothetical protein